MPTAEEWAQTWRSDRANMDDVGEDQYQMPPMASEEAVSKSFDRITAGLIDETPSPDEVMRAIRSAPVINPLAIMRGQQSGAEILPSTILKAQRAASVKERAQLLALLQDQQTHEMRRQMLQTQQARLAFDMMKQGASQGNAGVGAAYKAFVDISKDMDPEQANKWLDTMMKADVSQGIPDEATGRQLALTTLMQSGGLKAKQKERTAPSGFEYGPQGQLQPISGGPEDPRFIRQQALARHVESGGGGGAVGFFAPGMTTTTRQYQDEQGRLITESVPMGVMRPKSGEAPYAVPMAGVPESTKVKPHSIAEAGRIQGQQQGIEIVDQIEQAVFPGGKLDRGVLAGATAARHGVPGVIAPEGAMVNQRILQAMDPYVRSTTGAALNEQELRNAEQMFAPSVGDSEAQVRDKLDRLRSFLGGNLSLLGVVLQPGSAAYQGMQSRMVPAYPGIAAPTPPIAPPPGPQPAIPTRPAMALSGQIPRISSDAEYNALPSGATFIDPDGKRRRKP